MLLIDQTLAQHDWLVRERAAVALDRLRRNGSTILLASHEEDLLRLLADEIWWLREGRLAGRGDAEEMLTAYRQHIAARVRAWGSATNAALSPRMRRGDGRAEVSGIETLGENGQPTIVWRSGELAVVNATVRFRDAVADPVVGMMIRTRIGLNVYGTNTELERVKLGPCAAGETLTDRFRIPLRAVPGRIYVDAGVARSRWRLARLVGRCGSVRGDRRSIYGGRGQSAGARVTLSGRR